MAENEDTPHEKRRDKVVYLDAYRKPFAGSAGIGAPSFSVYAHLYIDLCSDGETRFGIVGANSDNAIGLLEPIFVLGRQLVNMATE
ncbi:hypothetical protein [Paraburkholderia acidiphila]|uniref:Uncharacterized protein n=1 Tax=Paraburkholderia acidiphila TaxID=2571747 RepID=A0A7Z2G7N0_9BURK|nr:hypothetical protein [Paraburkholderia acidiphila]QGZ56718.1 hypothetical protein FAZ97_17285 [Paraburkholderia acidiphila]